MPSSGLFCEVFSVSLVTAGTGSVVVAGSVLAEVIDNSMLVLRSDDGVVRAVELSSTTVSGRNSSSDSKEINTYEKYII